MNDKSRCAACGTNVVVLEMSTRDGGFVGVRVPGQSELLPLLTCVCPACGQATMHVPGFVTAGAAPMAFAPAPDAPGAPYRSAPPRLATVILAHPGANKISVIRALRELFRLDLKDAKDLTERPMCVLARGIQPADAERIRAVLAAEGATVHVEG